MNARPNLIGRKFGRLTVIRDTDERIRGYRMWECRCECGSRHLASTDVLQAGHTRSCGCYKRECCRAVGKKMALPGGVAAFNRLFESYRTSALQRKVFFDLSKEQAKELFQSPCFYCGAEPCRIAKSRTASSPFVYNGIDRIKNSVGYVWRNCVAACTLCNYRKSSMDYSDFVSWVRRVNAHLAGK